MVPVAYSRSRRGLPPVTTCLSASAKPQRRAQICLRWLIQQGIAVIPRTSKAERLQENFAV